jgi:hypothetical protein
MRLQEQRIVSFWQNEFLASNMQSDLDGPGA